MRSALTLFVVCISIFLQAQPTESYEWEVNSGYWCKLTFYSDHIVRFQFRETDQEHLPDDRYEMVLSHETTGQFKRNNTGRQTIFQSRLSDLQIRAGKGQLLISDGKQTLLNINDFIHTDSLLKINALYNSEEHFCGLGHQSYALVESLDLAGKTVSSNYGEGKVKDWGAQGVLTVPFFMSDRGYGLFLNSTFPHQFNFGEDGEYSFQLSPKGYEGRMDLLLIYGPSPRDILNHYTRLTGRPVMLPKSVFGLQLSDKGFPDNNGMDWWIEKVKAHREAGFPLDHLTHDNRWRAGSGAWSGSWFEWDSTRYDNPAAFQAWAKEQGLTMTLDLNRNIMAASEGYQPAFNLPHAEEYIKEGFSAPDFTNPRVRQWIWELFWQQSFNPQLNYPGNGLWIDETDELWPLPDTVLLHNGWPWVEAANYYNFLIAKAIVEEGWLGEEEQSLDTRPFVWQRALTAGAQRWSTHWSGDLKCSYGWMEGNIRGMLASGLSGFPYFNHDAGGFREGPDNPMYIQWAMAMGSFSPIWRPHGFGPHKRWPLDRNPRCQQAALKYGKLRYQWMPYLYTYARKAHTDGLPIARAMMIDYPDSEEAWAYDLQYMWGNEMLVAPTCSDWKTSQQIWLPPDNEWVDFWTEKIYPGGQIINYEANIDEIPLFVKRGAIIPGSKYVQSVAFADDSHLVLNLYTGANGRFELYEDDGVTREYQQGAHRITLINLDQQSQMCTIARAEGHYDGAPGARSYELIYHLLPYSPAQVLLNGQPIPKEQYLWEGNKLRVNLNKQPIDKETKIRLLY